MMPKNFHEWTKQWIKVERLNQIERARPANAMPCPLHRIALESFLIAGRQMMRPVFYQ